MTWRDVLAVVAAGGAVGFLVGAWCAATVVRSRVRDLYRVCDAVETEARNVAALYDRERRQHRETTRQLVAMIGEGVEAERAARAGHHRTPHRPCRNQEGQP